MSNKNRNLKVGLFAIYLLTFILVLGLVKSTPVTTYISVVKQNSIQVNQSGEVLSQKIKELAEEIDTLATDARVDPIWKGIPGYNGLQINQEKSYQLAKQLGQLSIETLVIDQVKPKVQLEDLPPQPIYRGNPNKPMISLMVNVAWGTEHVHQMLNIFDQYNVKATFFLDGKWLLENEEVARVIIQNGHEIGNHAYSHPDLKTKSEQKIYEEIVKTENLIRKLGVSSKLFAPPSGSYDQRVVNIAHRMKMKVILWTLDTVDWKKPPAEIIVNRIVPNLENGALILMHPTSSTVEALPSIIEGAFQKQFLLGTASDLLSSERAVSIVRLE
jgi:probable sporulation protein (polysaccharide deacetylase family)